MEAAWTTHTFKGGMEDKESGKNLRRIRARFIYCLVVTVVLVVSVILFVILSVRRTMPVLEHAVYTACPEGWIGFGRKCFYFSEDIRNWTYSQAFCASVDADLTRPETLEELKFLGRYKGPSDHWIGLHRESSYHLWKWTDDTDYNAMFVIKGVGVHAYLNDSGISSARNYTEKKWICSKPNDVYMCQSHSESL